MGKAKSFKTKTKLKAAAPLVKCYTPAVALSASLCFVCNAGAQTSEQIKLGTAPEVGVATLSGELTASKYVQDPGAPYENVFKNFDLGLNAGPKVGAGNVKVGLGPVALAPGINTPIGRGFRPEDAELKIGPFYLDLTDFTASILASDNARLTQQNRKSDVSAALSLGTEAFLQLNDGLQFALRGRFIYLPFENRAGVDGFGIADPFAQLTLDGTTLFRAQISYEFTLGNWEGLVWDDFQIRNQSLYRLGEGDFLDAYDGETFRSEKTFTGKNEIYRSGSFAPQGYRDDLNNPNRFDESELYYINQIGGQLSRVLPTVTRATARYTHDNVWFSSGSRLQDYTRDVFTARLQSERENLRFKPFAQYQALKYSTEPGWEHRVSAGLRGPITDQLELFGEGGYYFRTGAGSNTSSGTIWLVGLNHVAGPYTKHTAVYYRQIADPERQLRETFSYQLAQILGPYLVGGFYFSRDKYGDLDSKATFVEETVVGSYLTYNLGTHGSLSSQLYYYETDYTDPARGDNKHWIFRLIYSLEISPKSSGLLYYQFQTNDSDRANTSYYENLFGASFTRRF